MTLSAREIAEIFAPPKTPLRHRHGVVVSVQDDHTCTVRVAGSGVEIPGVRYTAAACPRPGGGVLLEVSGSDLFCIDTIAPAGPAFCQVRRTTDQNIPNASTTPFGFGTSVVTDEWGMISGSAFLVKVPGVYLVTFGWAFEGHSSGYRSAGILKNGTFIGRDRRLPTAGGTPVYATTVAMDAFAAGDAITVELYQNSGGGLALVGGAPDRSRLTATYLGPA